MYRVGRAVKLLSLSLLGGLLVLMRHILKTLQPLESALSGDARIYKWTHGHVYYKVPVASDALPLVVLHAAGSGASVYKMRHISAALARSYRIYALRASGFPDIDYFADSSKTCGHLWTPHLLLDLDDYR